MGSIRSPEKKNKTSVEDNTWNVEKAFPGYTSCVWIRIELVNKLASLFFTVLLWQFLTPGRRCSRAQRTTTGCRKNVFADLRVPGVLLSSLPAIMYHARMRGREIKRDCMVG